jgi:hypothetical protein
MDSRLRGNDKRKEKTMSKDYTDITVNNNGQPWPDTRAIDASGPAATDGTELVKEVTDADWLRHQSFMDFFNFDPNDLDDLPGVDGSGYPLSQPLLAKYLNYGIPGDVISLAWSAANDPVTLAAALGCDIRLLALNGQGILRANYTLLDSLVYVGDPANPTADYFYHADDAAGTIRNTTGIYLILPDTRGYFLRGHDPSGTIDPEGASRLVGSMQDHALQNITGIFHISRFDDGSLPLYDFSGAIEFDGYFTPARDRFDKGAGVNNQARISFDASRVANTSPDETRPVNIAIRHFIRY